MMVFVSELAKSLCFERDLSTRIGYTLLKIALDEGITPDTIGKRLGMRQRAVCDLLLGRRKFTFETMSDLAFAMGGRTWEFKAFPREDRRRSGGAEDRESD